ncbi:MAG: hypothetical protein GY821_03255 [Gammaproteobacteria bacterium]|nr:hypothetical protein [Gammaproteobacteria bacterium]
MYQWLFPRQQSTTTVSKLALSEHIKNSESLNGRESNKVISADKIVFRPGPSDGLNSVYRDLVRGVKGDLSVEMTNNNGQKVVVSGRKSHAPPHIKIGYKGEWYEYDSGDIFDKNKAFIHAKKIAQIVNAADDNSLEKNDKAVITVDITSNSNNDGKEILTYCLETLGIAKKKITALGGYSQEHGMSLICYSHGSQNGQDYVNVSLNNCCKKVIHDRNGHPVLSIQLEKIRVSKVMLDQKQFEEEIVFPVASPQTMTFDIKADDLHKDDGLHMQTPQITDYFLQSLIKRSKSLNKDIEIELFKKKIEDSNRRGKGKWVKSALNLLNKIESLYAQDQNREILLQTLELVNMVLYRLENEDSIEEEGNPEDERVFNAYLANIIDLEKTSSQDFQILSKLLTGFSMEVMDEALTKKKLALKNKIESYKKKKSWLEDGKKSGNEINNRIDELTESATTLTEKRHALTELSIINYDFDDKLTRGDIDKKTFEKSLSCQVRLAKSKLLFRKVLSAYKDHPKVIKRLQDILNRVCRKQQKLTAKQDGSVLCFLLYSVEFVLANGGLEKNRRSLLEFLDCVYQSVGEFTNKKDEMFFQNRVMLCFAIDCYQSSQNLCFVVLAQKAKYLFEQTNVLYMAAKTDSKRQELIDVLAWTCQLMYGLHDEKSINNYLYYANNLADGNTSLGWTLLGIFMMLLLISGFIAALIMTGGIFGIGTGATLALVHVVGVTTLTETIEAIVLWIASITTARAWCKSSSSFFKPIRLSKGMIEFAEQVNECYGVTPGNDGLEEPIDQDAEGYVNKPNLEQPFVEQNYIS